MIESIGGVYGRFQPIHNEHRQYILKTLRNCEYLIICITCPDPGSRFRPEMEPERASSEANPFSYFERLQMIEKMLDYESIPRKKYDIVPISFSKLNYICHYVPDEIVFYTIIYGEWGEEKRNMLKSVGFEVDELPDSETHEKSVTGTEVRKKISNQEQWSHLVPDPVYKYISENNLHHRLY